MSIDDDRDAGIRRAIRYSLGMLVVMAALAMAAYLWFGQRHQSDTLIQHEAVGPVTRGPETVAVPELEFTDITLSSGIDFVHENGADGQRLLPETMGGGVAFLDYDGDGNQDLLFVNSNRWAWQPPLPRIPTMQLYRGNGDATFSDVTAAVGLAVPLYGMGVAVGDFDGDARVDLFVTAVGENRLFRNTKGGVFKDVTEAAGVAGLADAWSTSAAFFDYDADGDLDLFVANYVDWSREINSAVDYRLTGIGRAYGPPTDFGGTQSQLYRNDGGVFVDVASDAGIHVVNATTGLPVGKGLAVHPVDVNGDGWLDIAVANDTVRNFLFINERNGHFRESGVEYGLAFDSGGLATGAMGIDAAHYANDGRLGIVIGNFANEMSSFYVSRSGEQVFSDDAIVAGIGADSRRVLTFGTMFLDIDLDGRLDLLAANGHVEPEINSVQMSQQYAQPLQVFWNCGEDCRRQYRSASGMIGDASEPMVGRGASYGDIDGDGDLDVVVTAVGGRARLLRNDQDLGHHWISIELRGDPRNRAAIGANVIVDAAGVKQYRAVMPTRSYLSQVALPLIVGLGKSATADAVTVVWPDGDTEVWAGLEADRRHLLVKGASKQP